MPGRPGDSIPVEKRLLANILLGKENKTDSIELEVKAAQMQKVASIVDQLLADPSKIQHLFVYAAKPMRDLEGKDGKKVRKLDAQVEQLNSAEFFDSKVKCLADIPAPWLWSLLKKTSTPGISQVIIDNLSQRSNVPLKQIVHYLSGIRPDFVLSGDMRKVDTFARFLTKQVVDRRLVNKPDAHFFGPNGPIDGPVVSFKAPNGVFQLIFKELDSQLDPIQPAEPPAPGDDAAAEEDDEAGSIYAVALLDVMNNKRVDFSKEDYIKGERQIHNNFAHEAAYIEFLGSKQPLLKLFNRFAGEAQKTLVTSKRTKQQMVEAGTNFLKARVEDKKQAEVTVDVDVFRAAKRKRPRTAAPAAVPIAAP